MTRYDALPTGLELAGRFVITARLGNGQFAAVYQARDRTTATSVALKVLNPQFADDPIATERFVREVQVLRSVQHPNVVKVYDVFHDGPWSIICMEWFDAVDCRTYLDRNGPMPVAELLPVARTIVAALQACHRLKIVHRDLKPQNVLINARREIKLVDFGMSKMQTMPDVTRTGTVIGTPQYLAPEMFRSTRADPRSDIYALGAIFYELLTDRPPYRAQTLAEVMTRQLREEIEALSTYRQDVPTWLDRIVRTCLRTDPAARYQSCYELARDLDLGTRARARPPGEPLACGHCRAALIPGLPFCHQCGQLRDLAFEPGRSSVVLIGCDQPQTLQAHLQRTFPWVRIEVAAQVSRLPAVVVRGVSNGTAHRVMHQFAAVPCELRVTDRLASAFEIPGRHAALVCAVVVALFWWITGLAAAARAAVVIAAELIIVGLFWIRTQPLITPPRHRQATAPIDPAVLAMVQQLKALTDAGLKTILGTIMRSFLAVRDHLPSAPSTIAVDTVRRAVGAALAAARTLEAQAVYLASTTLTELHARLRAVDARLADLDGSLRDSPEHGARNTEHGPQPRACGAASVLADADKLIATKANLQRELQCYYDIQDAHAVTYVALVNLQGVLQRIEDALGASTDVSDALGELREVADDLQREPPHA